METAETRVVTVSTQTTTQGARAGGELDLDALSRRDSDALGRLYARGTVPPRLDALEGNPRGLMLAVRHLDHGPVGAALRAIAGGAGFPWGGKTFHGSGERGTGINRVHLGGRHSLFPFRTLIRPSVLDRSPAVILDYDLPDNPAFIRAIHDEVRAIEDGLFLGPAMWKGRAGNAPILVLWFALDVRVQAPPIGEKS
jgi:hypothetical protein